MVKSNRGSGDGMTEGVGVSRADVARSLVPGTDVLPEAACVSRRDFLAGTGALVFALLFDVAHARSSSSGPVRVGVIMSGNTGSSELDSLLAGFDLFAKEQGAGSLQLLKKQAGPREEKTLEALVQLLIREDIRFLIAPDSVASSEKCIHGLPEDKVILFITHPSVKLVSGELCPPAVFRLTPNTFQAAKPLAPWALRNLGTKAFLTGQDDDQGNEEADFFAYGFERAGGTFANRVMALPESKAVATIAQDVRTIKPDFVFASFRGKAAQMFLKQYHDGKSDRLPPVIGPESLASYPQPAKELAKACDGVRTMAFIKDPVRFASQVRRKVGRSIASAERAAQGYDIAQVILKATEKQGAHREDKVAELIKIIEGLEIEGPRGKIRFDKNHEPILDAHVAQWEWDGNALHRKPVADLGACVSLDFGCGRVGFPPKQKSDEPEEGSDQANAPE
jgi:ABC-type branched-subunit amino acid transport system substrate-binding protein